MQMYTTFTSNANLTVSAATAVCLKTNFKPMGIGYFKFFNDSYLTWIIHAFGLMQM